VTSSFSATAASAICTIAQTPGKCHLTPSMPTIARMVFQGVVDVSERYCTVQLQVETAATVCTHH
jgi:hypothetical protein